MNEAGGRSGKEDQFNDVKRMTRGVDQFVNFAAWHNQKFETAPLRFNIHGPEAKRILTISADGRTGEDY